MPKGVFFLAWNLPCLYISGTLSTAPSRHQDRTGEGNAEYLPQLCNAAVKLHTAVKGWKIRPIPQRLRRKNRCDKNKKVFQNLILVPRLCFEKIMWGLSSPEAANLRTVHMGGDPPGSRLVRLDTRQNNPCPFDTKEPSLCTKNDGSLVL